MQVEKLVTGGQTGVDRAALDAALALGLSVGGWCPKGRRAEDGIIAARYPLRETPSEEYAQRTAWNVRDSDGTLILHAGTLSGGTALTVVEAHRLGKPVHDVCLDRDAVIEPVVEWLRARHIRVLNVAGPRESEAPGIYGIARAFLERLFQGGN